jgi:hypothetical protein
LGAALKPRVWLTLGIAALGFDRMFYGARDVKPLLTNVTHLSFDTVARCWPCSASLWWRATRLALAWPTDPS